jgi:hypothetical protein
VAPAASGGAPGRDAAAPLRGRATTPGRPRSRARRALAVVTALVALLACDPYVKGNGVLREDTRNVGAFEGLRVEDGIQAEVTAGAAEQRVALSGDENLLEHIQTLVRADAAHGEVLEVRSTLSSFDSTHPLRVVVSVPVLRFVGAKDECFATISGASAEIMTVDAADGADVRLAGRGGAQLSVRLTGGQRGGAHLGAREYRAEDATVELSGGARAELRVSERVSGTVSGAETALDNVGGACDVTVTDGATVSCAPGT